MDALVSVWTLKCQLHISSLDEDQWTEVSKGFSLRSSVPSTFFSQPPVRNTNLFNPVHWKWDQSVMNGKTTRKDKDCCCRAAQKPTMNKGKMHWRWRFAACVIRCHQMINQRVPSISKPFNLGDWSDTWPVDSEFGLPGYDSSATNSESWTVLRTGIKPLCPPRHDKNWSDIKKHWKITGWMSPLLSQPSAHHPTDSPQLAWPSDRRQVSCLCPAARKSQKNSTF